MRIDEVWEKRDIGINYDQQAADTELRNMYMNDDIEPELVKKILDRTIQDKKEVMSMVRQLKTRYGLMSRTNSVAMDGLLQLMLNVRNSEIELLSKIYREKKHAT